MRRWLAFLPALLLAGSLAPGATAEPPPHAPAHGYRHKHAEGIELVFDARFGLYAVAERARHFFLEGAFFRFHEGHWQRAPHLDGPWDRLEPGRLPAPLERFAAEDDVGERGGRGPGPPGRSRPGPPGSKGPEGPKGAGAKPPKRP